MTGDAARVREREGILVEALWAKKKSENGKSTTEDFEAHLKKTQRHSMHDT